MKKHARNLIPPRDDGVAAFLNQLLGMIPAEERKALAGHLRLTPDRLLRMYRDELLAGYKQDPQEVLGAVFEDPYDEIVVVKDIQFYSMCSHHLLPFFGTAAVAYIPKGRVVGLSKLARLVECYSRRLQIQERLTEQIAKAMMEHLRPGGAACIMVAEHLCMGCRGVEKPGSLTVTSTLLGRFRSNPPTRAELMTLLDRKR